MQASRSPTAGRAPTSPSSPRTGQPAAPAGVGARVFAGCRRPGSPALAGLTAGCTRTRPPAVRCGCSGQQTCHTVLQLYHMCEDRGPAGRVAHNFLCPNGTLFSQETLSCSAWHQVTPVLHCTGGHYWSVQVNCDPGAVSLLAGLNEVLDMERQFLDSGAAVQNPLVDLPWRYRDREV